MTRIVHLTDLHFGMERPHLADELIRAVNECAPDLIVCTGDVVHRARPDWFDKARRFADALDAPFVTVPGNHDIPLYNLPLRLSRPFSDLRRAFPDCKEWVTHAGQICVIGANTTNKTSWQKGRVSLRQLDRSCRIAEQARDDGYTVVLAIHHPLEHHPNVEKDRTINAEFALERLESAGVSVVLSGHLHRWFAEYFVAQKSRGLLQVQGGTALCDRPTDRQNEFATLDFDGQDLTITRYVAPIDAPQFLPWPTINLSRQSGVWQAV